MYEYNDYVAEFMKMEIETSINEAEQNDDCRYPKRTDGFFVVVLSMDDSYTLGELWEDCLNELHNVQNYWLHEEFPYAVYQKDG